MLRRHTDRHGETGEVSDSEDGSDEEEAHEKTPLNQKTGSFKRKSVTKHSTPPRKRSKVTFI